MRPRHVWYDQCINGGVAWLCKRGQDSQLQVHDHAYTIIIGAKDGLNKIHVQSRSQLLSCPGHIQTPVPSMGYQGQCATGLQVSLTHSFIQFPQVASRQVARHSTNTEQKVRGRWKVVFIRNFTRNMFFDTSTASNGNQLCFDGIRGTKFSSTCYISCCLPSLPHVIELNHQNVNERVRRML